MTSEFSLPWPRTTRPSLLLTAGFWRRAEPTSIRSPKPSRLPRPIHTCSESTKTTPNTWTSTDEPASGYPVCMTPPRDTTVFEVQAALKEPGCAVCRLASRSVGRLIQTVAYDQVNDIALRGELRAAHGFCNQHAYRWLHEAHNVLGTAIIYRELIAAAVDDLDTAAPRGRLLRALRGSETEV